MSPKIFSACAFGISLALLFSSASRADQELPSSCAIYASLLTEPFLIKNISADFPEGFASMERTQQSALIAKKLSEAGLSDEVCRNKIGRTLQNAEAINTVFPKVCQQFRSEFQEKMTGNLMSESKAAQMTHEKTVELYMLKSRSVEKLQDYCGYALSVLNNESLARQDFDDAKRKYPLTEACEGPFGNLTDQFFGKPTNSGAAYVLGMAKSRGIFHMTLMKRAYLASFYGDDSAGLSAFCEREMGPRDTE